MSDSCCKTLFAAAKKGHIGCVEKLIAAGADVNVKNANEWISLMFAANYGHVDCVEKLISAGADVNAKTEFGWTSLMFAAEQGHVVCIEKLIAAGADVNAKTEYGWTSLMFTAHNRNTECVEKLIDVNADVNAKTENGWTSLMVAAHYGRDECIEKLIKAGADVNAKNNNGKTALMIAVTTGDAECVEILKIYLDENADERIEKIKNYRLMKELKPHIESIDIDNLELDFDGIKRKLNADEKELVTCIISQSFTLDPVHIVAPGVTDKQVYDRKNIDIWLSKHKISPITKQICINYILQPVDEATGIIEKIKNCFLRKIAF